jgi:signal transduction histidine kinase
MSDASGHHPTVRWQGFGLSPEEMKILAVDDNEALRYSVVRCLRDAGYQLLEARTGKEALERVKELPDLITLDVNLPDMHGFQVCREIKSDPVTSHIPILHLSSTYTDPDSRVQGLASGADAYLSEPIDRAELVATVRALLRLKHAETLARQQAEIAESARKEVAELNATLEGRVSERTVELANANENLRELSSRLLQMQDDERRRIARELHDGVGQLLAGLAMNQALISEELEKLSARGRKAFAENITMTEEIIQSIRTMSHLLHPPLLEEMGLRSALEWYVEEFGRRSNIKAVLECPSVPRMQIELETAIFRIIQECLGNVHRHSGSATVTIRVKTKGDRVEIEVSDQGKGIPANRQLEIKSGGKGGVGLRGMRERIARFGGQLEIDSSQKGTTIRATLPSTPADSAVDESRTQGAASN